MEERLRVPWSNGMENLFDAGMPSAYAGCIILRQFVFLILVNSAMARKLSHIVNAYILLLVIYATHVWSYIAAMHKENLHSLLDMGSSLALNSPVDSFPA